MFPDFKLVIPANTLDAVPVRMEVDLPVGIIHRLMLLFPPGPHGMVKVRILEHDHQVWPSNLDGYFASDDEVIDIVEHYEILEPPVVFYLVGSSPGTTYSHTISVRFGILAPEVIEPYTGIMGLLKKFLKMVGVG